MLFLSMNSRGARSEFSVQGAVGGLKPELQTQGISF